MTEHLNESDVAFEPSSALDKAGRVFYWKGDVFRAIRPSRAQFFRRLLLDESRSALSSFGMAQTAIAPISLNGYGLILQHARTPFVSYCGEWPAEMFKDAALFTCELSAKLYNRGLVLKDAHPWNVQFSAAQPVFVDWGSLEELTRHSTWPIRDFRDRFLFPLWLMASGLHWAARMYMLDTRTTPDQSGLTRLGQERPGKHRRLLRILGGAGRTQDFHEWLKKRRLNCDGARPEPELFRRLQLAVREIRVTNRTTEWSAYSEAGRGQAFHPCSSWPRKIRNVHKILAELNPKTVLDFGCNQGWFSELAARMGARVVGLDIDEPSLAALYRRARDKDLWILPLRMDASSPTPSHGIANTYRSATERLKSDMVLALAITHHLALKQAVSFPWIAEQIAAFARRWALVEFVPRTDRHVKQWPQASAEWYTAERFEAALRARFREVDLLPSSPDPRVLFLCRR